MKNKIKMREEVIEEVVMKLENVMDWYKGNGDGVWRGGWSIKEVEEIIKRFVGKE